MNLFGDIRNDFYDYGMIFQVVMVLKKDITKTHTEGEQDDSGNYRQLLVRTLHACCVKYPDVAPTVVPMLIEFLGDSNEQASLDVLVFVREAVLKFTSLKKVIIEKLLENFHTIRNVKIHRHALWILGEHCSESNEIISVIKEIKSGLGELPMVDDELRRASGNEENADEAESSKTSSGGGSSQVTADGTYATQSALVTKTSSKGEDEKRPPLRSYLLKGDFFIGSAIGSTLTKLALRFLQIDSNTSHQNKFCAEAMMIMASIIHLGKSGIPEKAITEDDLDRLAVCVKVLAEKNEFMKQIFNVECRNAVSSMLDASKAAVEYGKGKCCWCRLYICI